MSSIRFPFGYGSIKVRDTLHPDLQKLVDEISQTFNCTLVCGYRDQEAQNKAYREGKSQKQWPDSRHNTFPSEAVDIAPFKNGSIQWNDLMLFSRMIGHIESAAIRLGIEVEFGGDWKTFVDWPHIQLKKRTP